MAAPTFVQHAESVWNTNTTPKTASVTVQAGDILVCYAVAADGGTTFANPTNDGTALTWTVRPNVGTTGATCRAAAWTAPVDSNRTIVVSVGRTGSAGHYGMCVRAYRASDGVGNTGSVAGDTSANFSAAVTTTQANSALDWQSGDWTPVSGARTVLTTGVSTFSERTAVLDSGQFYIEGGYHIDTGAIAAKTIGVSAPSGQNFTAAVVEIKGSAGGATLERSAAIAATAAVTAANREFFSVESRSAALASTAAVQAAPQRVRIRQTALAATAAVTAAGTFFTILERSAAIASTTAIASSGEFETPAGDIHTRSAALASTAAVTTAGQHIKVRTAALAATATVTAAGEIAGAVTRSASLNATTAVQAAYLRRHHRATALTGTAAIQAAPQRRLHRQTALTAITAITAGGFVGVLAEYPLTIAYTEPIRHATFREQGELTYQEHAAITTRS